MTSENVHEGSCFCGSVKFRVTGLPIAMGYCHCESCRSWSASPVNAFTLWKPEAVEVVAGTEHIATFNRTTNSYRKWCKLCGGHIFSDHPEKGFVDVYAASIPSLAFAPTIHVHYQEKVLSIKDGLPKMKDRSARTGGSGITLPE